MCQGAKCWICSGTNNSNMLYESYRSIYTTRVPLLLLIQYELVVWKLSIQLYYSSYLLCIVFILSSRSMQTVRIILLLL